MDSVKVQLLVVLTALTGLVYIGVGIIHTSLFVTQNTIFGFPMDPIQGLLLVIVGFVFIGGIKPLQKKSMEGYAFVIVGGILATLLFLLQMIVIGTNLLGWYLQLEDWINWSLANDISPAIWLFPLTVLLLLYTKFKDPLEKSFKKEGI
ncbi:MAG: hypothetical protein GF411_12330 [Candidatus Lokiarchaeota archaeon]|nr:hypothetical protein [Candidatus Lokiarchaeota archaeon]